MYFRREWLLSLQNVNNVISIQHRLVVVSFLFLFQEEYFFLERNRSSYCTYKKKKGKKRNSRICSNYIFRIKIFFDNLFHPLYPSKGSEVRVQIVFHLPLAQVELFIERSRSKYEKETRIRCNFWEKGNERRRGRRRKRRRRSRREPIRHRLRRSRLLFYSRVIPFPSPSPLPPAYPQSEEVYTFESLQQSVPSSNSHIYKVLRYLQ